MKENLRSEHPLCVYIIYMTGAKIELDFTCSCPRQNRVKIIFQANTLLRMVYYSFMPSFTPI